MKPLKLLAVAVAAAMAMTHSMAAPGSHSKRGYVKKNGTYVAPSHATNPNKSKRDNYSSRGNTNPYNGKQGTKNPDGQGR